MGEGEGEGAAHARGVLQKQKRPTRQQKESYYREKETYCREKLPRMLRIKVLLEEREVMGKLKRKKKRKKWGKSYLVCCASKCFLRSGKYWGKFIFVTGAPASMAMQSAARAACSARNSQTGSALR